MPKRYDLEERTERFAKRVRAFTRGVTRDKENDEDIRQLIRASGSVGANYIEANEALSKRDFIMRIKICRKEAKECGYFLRLIEAGEDKVICQEQTKLIQEAHELMCIFGTILRNSEK